MHCTKCGQQNEDGDQFCGSCGTKLRVNSQRSINLDNATIPPASEKHIPVSFDRSDPSDLIRQKGNTFMYVPIQPGVILAGRYKIMDFIGSGGMAQVWKAHDNTLDIPVAIKALPPEAVKNPVFKSAMKREAQLSIRLSHPHIGRLLTYEDDGKISFLAMEFVDGVTLEQMIHQSSEQRIQLETLIPIFERVASAIDFAHSQSPPILHRDIKPANIIVKPQGAVKVVDFGIACELHNTMTRMTGRASAGTLLYMSPEQIRGTRLTVASDIYSLAATLYECLAGHPPFHAGSIEYQIINELPVGLRELQVDISETQDHAILKGLSKKPEDRFQSCGEFLRSLKALASPMLIDEKTKESKDVIIRTIADLALQNAQKHVVSNLVVAADGTGDYLTITEALNYISIGGSIKVKPGHYQESLKINKNITLEGDGSRDSIIIAGNHLGTTSALIRNLTLAAYGTDAAILIEQGEPKVEDCVILGGLKGVTGILINGKGANPSIKRCEIRRFEYGISVQENGIGTIEDCDIYENNGAGVVIKTGGNPRIKMCKIHKCEGSGIHVFGNGLGTIEDCEIYEIKKSNVIIKTGGNPSIKNCKIHNGEQAGILVCENGIGAIEDCEIYENKKSNVIIKTGGKPSIKNCKIHNGEQAGIFVCENGIGTIEDCEIYENKKAGVSIITLGNPSMERCKIHNGENAGIHVHENGISTIEDCEIYKNKKSGVIITTGGNPIIKRCEIHNGEDAGIYVDENGIGTIEDCEIYKNKLSGVDINTGGNPSIKRCKIHNGEDAGIHVYENGIGTIDDCEIYENKGSGLAIRTGGSPIIKKCKIHNGEHSGIHVYENGKGTIEDCEIYENIGSGLAITTGGNPSMKRCKIHSGEDDGICVHENGVGTIDVCEIFENNLVGIRIKTGGNPSIKNCKIHNGENAGIYALENGKGTIEGCEIYENKLQGVVIQSGGNPSIKNCKIHNGGSTGIYVCENGIGTIEDCEIYENKREGICIKSGGNPSIKNCKINNGELAGNRVYETKFRSVQIATSDNPITKNCKEHKGEDDEIDLRDEDFFVDVDFELS
jgi:F-box protein 11